MDMKEVIICKCGCTDYNACEDGCYWVAEELCSKCADELINQNKTLQQELSIANDKLKKIEELCIENIESCSSEGQLKHIEDEPIEKLKYREDNIEMQIEAYADKINELVDEINELKKVGSK